MYVKRKTEARLPKLFGMQSACAVLYYHLWPLWLNHIYPHYLKKRQDFRNDVVEYKVCILIFCAILCETFFILRIIQRDTIINVHSSVCKVPIILAIF